MTEMSSIELAAFQVEMTDSQKMMFQTQYNASKKDRTVGIILSILFGTLGIDRFYIGDTGMGILKLLTGGLCGILWVIDWFLIMGKIDDLNRAKAQEIAAAVKVTAAAAPEVTD